MVSLSIDVPGMCADVVLVVIVHCEVIMRGRTKVKGWVLAGRTSLDIRTLDLDGAGDGLDGLRHFDFERLVAEDVCRTKAAANSDPS